MDDLCRETIAKNCPEKLEAYDRACNSLEEKLKKGKSETGVQEDCILTEDEREALQLVMEVLVKKHEKRFGSLSYLRPDSVLR